jgi:hypothetical protein
VADEARGARTAPTLARKGREKSVNPLLCLELSRMAAIDAAELYRRGDSARGEDCERASDAWLVRSRIAWDAEAEAPKKGAA